MNHHTCRLESRFPLFNHYKEPLMSRESGDNLDRNPSSNLPMASVMDAYLSRRTVMRGSLGAAIAMIAGTGLTACFRRGWRQLPP